MASISILNFSNSISTLLSSASVLRILFFSSASALQSLSLSSALRIFFSVFFIRRHSSIKNLLLCFSSNPNASTCCLCFCREIDLLSVAICCTTSLQRNPGRVPQAVAEYGESLDLCINVRWMKILRLKIRLVGFNGLL